MPFYSVLCTSFILLFIFQMSILIEANRVPFDLPESESELIAGFITEYNTIYSSLILSTEYANIITLLFFIIILFSFHPLFFIIFLFLICSIRSTLNRLKFDELMMTAWIIILPIEFSFPLFLLLILPLLSMAFNNLCL